MSINRRMDKENAVPVYSGILLSQKKEIIPFAVTWVDLVSEVREKQISCDITYMWNLKYNTNELIYEKEIDSQL